MKNPEADYDGAWKATIEQHLPELVERFFPEVYALIDWGRGFEFKEQELADAVMAADGERGRGSPRRVDALVRVYLKDGGEQWLLLHIEAQSFPEDGFEARIYECYLLLRVKFRVPVLPLLILADARPGWHPKEYVEEWGRCGRRSSSRPANCSTCSPNSRATRRSPPSSRGRSWPRTGRPRTRGRAWTRKSG